MKSFLWFIVVVLFLNIIPILAASSTSPSNDTTTTTTTTTTNNLPTDAPTSTTQPLPLPFDPNTPTSSIEEIQYFFAATAKTCCHIQTSCDGCRNFFDVNSIRYCCPGCNGNALVTDLVCSCYPPDNFDPSVVHCKVNNTKVVGDYIPWRPSYYKAEANVSRTSVVLSFFFLFCIFSIFELFNC